MSPQDAKKLRKIRIWGFFLTILLIAIVAGVSVYIGYRSDAINKARWLRNEQNISSVNDKLRAADQKLRELYHGGSGQVAGFELYPLEIDAIEITGPPELTIYEHRVVWRPDIKAVPIDWTGPLGIVALPNEKYVLWQTSPSHWDGFVIGVSDARIHGSKRLE